MDQFAGQSEGRPDNFTHREMEIWLALVAKKG